MIKTQQTFEMQGMGNTAIISFEKQKIEIPLNFNEARDRAIYTFMHDLQERVSSLENELKNQKLLAESYFERQLSDEQAKIEIINYLKKSKYLGVNKINIIKLVTDLNLPAEQIERVMDNLQKDDIVKEND